MLTPSVSEGGEEQTKRDRIGAMRSSGVDASGVARPWLQASIVVSLRRLSQRKMQLFDEN